MTVNDTYALGEVLTSDVLYLFGKDCRTNFSAFNHYGANAKTVKLLKFDLESN